MSGDPAGREDQGSQEQQAAPSDAVRDPVAGLTIRYRTRFDECGPDGIVRTSALLRYAQDIAWVHSERLGFDRAWYAGRGLAWVVRAADLVILATIPLGTTLAISTAVTGIRRVWARRRTEARLGDGTLAFWGHTDWVMTDHRGMPGRVPPEFAARFAVQPGTFEPSRVSVVPAPPDAAAHRSTVRPQDIDPMGHVNNAAYVDYLEEALHAAGEPGRRALAAVPRRVRLEYVAAAASGAVLTGTAWPVGAGADDGWAWLLRDDGGRDLARGRVNRDGREAD